MKFIIHTANGMGAAHTVQINVFILIYTFYKRIKIKRSHKIRAIDISERGVIF